tara:strand:+ start:70042 stop:70848 length:807 start_codon:yes stop_codon:yes gene_type:complete
MNKRKLYKKNSEFSNIKLNSNIIGSNIIHLSHINSTMNYAWNLFEKNVDNNGTVIIADEQSEGRGRNGSIWYSEKSEDILCSIMLESRHKNLSELLIIASLAVVYTLEKILHNQNISIKWPNDVLVNQNKIAGVIAESSSKTFSNFSLAVVGIGLNVNLKCRGNIKLPINTTSIAEITDKKVSRLEIFELLLINFDLLFAKLNKNQDIISEWKKYLNSIGKRVSFNLKNSNDLQIGIVEDIDELGRLIIIDKEGKRRCLYDQTIRFID